MEDKPLKFKFHFFYISYGYKDVIRKDENIRSEIR